MRRSSRDLEFTFGPTRYRCNWVRAALTSETSSSTVYASLGAARMLLMNFLSDSMIWSAAPSRPTIEAAAEMADIESMAVISRSQSSRFDDWKQPGYPCNILRELVAR